MLLKTHPPTCNSFSDGGFREVQMSGGCRCRRWRKQGHAGNGFREVQVNSFPWVPS